MSRKVLRTPFYRELRRINIDFEEFVPQCGKARPMINPNRAGLWIAWDFDRLEPGCKSFNIIRGLTYALPPALRSHFADEDPTMDVLSAGDLRRYLTTDIYTKLEPQQVVDALASISTVHLAETSEQHAYRGRSNLGKQQMIG